MNNDDGARRVWFYKDGWSGPLIQCGGDEYGNRTVVLRLPGGRAMIVVWSIPLRRELEPFEGQVYYGLIGGPDDIDIDNPLPVSYADALRPAEGWTAVERTIWYGQWEELRDHGE